MDTRTLARLLPLVVAVALAGCGLLQPGTPGHEPPNAGGSYNPVSHEDNLLKTQP